MKKLAILLLPLVATNLIGCNDKRVDNVSVPAQLVAAPAPSAAVYDKTMSEGETPDALHPTQKRIARTHNLSIRTKGDDLAKRFEADSNKCVSLGCDITSSSIAENYANINARIEPSKLDDFLKFLSRDGAKISAHSVSAEDKTVQYIDTESRFRSMEALKERLLKLMASTSSTDIKAILEIEKELARVQQESDSAKSSLQYLSTITNLVTLQIDYSVELENSHTEYSDLKNSFHHSWQAFIRNIARVIEFIGAVLPWIPVMAFALWIIRTLARRRRKRED